MEDKIPRVQVHAHALFVKGSFELVQGRIVWKFTIPYMYISIILFVKPISNHFGVLQTRGQKLDTMIDARWDNLWF